MVIAIASASAVSTATLIAVNDQQTMLIKVRDNVPIWAEKSDAPWRVERLSAVPDVLTKVREKLNASISRVRDENHGCLWTDGHVPGIAKLSCSTALFAKLEEVVAGHVKRLVRKRKKQ